MTREEAKGFLIDISYKLGNMAVEYLTEKDGEKMREAIKVLEQEPCDNAVSRQAVLDLVVANHKELNGVSVIMYSPLCKDIKQLPPVNPQPKTGHWGKDGECPFCGYLQQWDDDNFCGHCGAKMQGVQK